LIIVTGTKRSGTSMWMQILIAAGFPSLGKAFPGIWEKSIKDANPEGFFESKFRQGLYYATNPDPETGEFIPPAQLKRHVVKIFVPGLIRTDVAYLGPAISTMRSWREYCSSLTRLYSMEDSFLADARRRGEVPPRRSFPSEHVEAIVRAGKLPPALEWWFENYDFVRDAATRRYPFHMTTYDRLLRDPGDEISRVIKWLGDGQLAPALNAVRPDLRTQKDAPAQSPADELVADVAEVFDELYDLIDRGPRTLDAAFVEKMNQTNKALSSRWAEVVRQRIDAIQRGVETTPSNSPE
jgi:hypothetical protein